MSALLSASGHRRTVVAIAVTGTVCAGVGIMCYAVVKKYRNKSKTSTDIVELEEENGKTPVTSENEPEQTKSEGEPKLPEDVNREPLSAINIKMEERAKPTPPITKPTPPIDKPTPPAAKPLVPTPIHVKEEPEEKTSPPQEPPKAIANKDVSKGVIAKVETIVNAATESALAEVISPVVAPVKKDIEKDIKHEAINKEKVQEKPSVEEKGEVKESVASPASGDKASSTSDLPTKIIPAHTLPDISSIGDTKSFSSDIKPTSPLSGVKIIKEVPTISETFAEQQDTEAPASMGVLSSLGDDIEILHDSSGSTDTTDSIVSGDFVKCNPARSADVSKTSDNIKATSEPDHVKKEDEPTVKVTEQPKLSAVTQDDEDDNGNFDQTSSAKKAEAVPVPTVKKEINDNHSEGK